MPSPAARLMVRVASLLMCLACAVPAVSQGVPPGFDEAQRIYKSALNLDQRLTFQVMLTAAGYWNAVASDAFGPRLFKAVQRFQAENGFVPDGIVTGPQAARLVAIAGPMLRLWGFRKVTHPTQRVTVWVPFGLGLTAVRNQFGVAYNDPQNRLHLDFTTVPNLEIGRNFEALVGNIGQQNGTIHYKVIKDGWFVISATTPDGADHYFRYHQDGANVTGFSLSWVNANGNVSGERIAVLMSASLWANMTGAPFVEPPSMPQAEVVSRAEPTPQEVNTPPVPSTPPAPSVPPAPAAGMVSTGTGFFVSADGSFVTAAHVVADCGNVQVKSDDGSTQEARVVARDATNDLALLKLDKGPAKFASLRIGIRLGEGVAAFGFPHTDLLSTSGNFTLGNVTALTGMGDDVRYLQVSAPVQAGNSGGPLLDQSGNLVGVVTAKLNALKMAMNNGDLPQNVNFAVKSAILTTFLDANRVSYATGTIAPKLLEPADLADQARAMSGFVVCR